MFLSLIASSAVRAIVLFLVLVVRSRHTNYLVRLGLLLLEVENVFVLVFWYRTDLKPESNTQHNHRRHTIFYRWGSVLLCKLWT